MSDVFDKCGAWKDYRSQDGWPVPVLPAHRSLPRSTEVDIEGSRMVMVGSNNYLGLAGDPRVKEAAITLMKSSAAPVRAVACSTAPDPARGTRGPLAKFLNRERRSWFDRLSDQYSRLFCRSLAATTWCSRTVRNHATLVDGVRLSFGEEKQVTATTTWRIWRSCSMRRTQTREDSSSPMASSRWRATSQRAQDCRTRAKYSARMMTDDAHSMGVLGETGRGTAEYFGLEKPIPTWSWGRSARASPHWGA